jgi:2-oxoisovalerate dehydrogenase E1 component
MYNRAEVIDRNFIKFVQEGRFPEARSRTGLHESGLTAEEFMDLFETQIMSRQMDLRARILKNQNECYYTIGSSGHEGNAVWGKVFRLTDMAFVHYRSCAFMIQRAKQLPGSTPLYDTMLSFVASSEDPIAGGRHKVFGSYPLMVPPQTSTIASHLPKAVGAALSIGRAKDLKLETAVMPMDSVVFCSFGDASINHSTAVGAVNSALWVSHQNIPTPLLFICEDNGIGISVPTPQNWLESQYGQRAGLHYIQTDGLNLCDLYLRAREAEDYVRRVRKPAFLHMKTIRLLGHAGSDMEMTYHSLAKIEATEFNDPLLHSARIALEHGITTADEIVKMYKRLEEQIAAIGEYSKTRPKYLKREEVRESLLACAFPKKSPEPPSESKVQELYGASEYAKLQTPLHLGKLINMALHETLLRYPGACVFGEDVAQKGGVYNVTDGLYKKFGPRRVFNSLLDEQTILGTAIGLAHNGFLPIPEIQFLAYVHNAEDQIRGEAATLAFFSQGQFTNGMVIRIAGLPYQKGFGGHFHNDNSLAIFRDIPGVVVAVPSNGEDAVKMFRTCTELAWEKGRVVVFVEPIALYMTRDLHQENDKAWTFNYPKIGEKIALGEFGVWGRSQELTIVTYGNGVYYSRQAAKILEEQHEVQAKIIDMRWMSDFNREALRKEIGNCPNVLIVDECRKTGSWSEWMCGFLLEDTVKPPHVKVVAADDCFIPLGKAAAAGLPSRDEIVVSALRLLNRI